MHLVTGSILVSRAVAIQSRQVDAHAWSNASAWTGSQVLWNCLSSSLNWPFIGFSVCASRVEKRGHATNHVHIRVLLQPITRTSEPLLLTDNVKNAKGSEQWSAAICGLCSVTTDLSDIQPALSYALKRLISVLVYVRRGLCDVLCIAYPLFSAVCTARNFDKRLHARRLGETIFLVYLFCLFFFQSLVSFTLESSIYIDDTHTIVLDIVSRLLTEVRIFPFVWHFFDWSA